MYIDVERLVFELGTLDWRLDVLDSPHWVGRSHSSAGPKSMKQYMLS